MEVGSSGIPATHDIDSVVLTDGSRYSSEAVTSQEEVNATIDVDANEHSDSDEEPVIVKTEPGVEKKEVVIKKEPGVSDGADGQPEAGPSNAEKSSPTPKGEAKKTKKRKSVRILSQNFSAY